MGPSPTSMCRCSRRRDHKLLERMWQWMRSHPKRDDFYFSHMVGSVFEGLARGAFAHAATFFRTKLASATTEDLALIGLLLREAPRGFVYDETAFVEQLLEHCAVIGHLATSEMISDLYASAVSGMRSGTVGQPMTEDLQQRDRSRERLASLSQTSPARTLFTKLHRSAETDIARAHQEAKRYED